MNTVSLWYTVFCIFWTNLSLRVHVSSSKDKLNPAINFSYSRLTETKLILSPSYITAIFLQFIQNYLQHQVASKCVWLLLIIKPESAVGSKISKSIEAKCSEEEKNSPLRTILILQSGLVSRSHKFVDRWKAKMVKSQKLDREAYLDKLSHCLLRGSLTTEKNWGERSELMLPTSLFSL